ncbi:MAG: FtsX-like permease family protein [Myxococcales bacterium]|nr:FtsX-like permease family protein [Myxococcales bacterium]
MTLVGLAARNVLRNKFRAVLTIVGVAVSILTFMLLRTVVYAWTAGAEWAAKDRVVTRHKVTFVMTLPKRYIDDVRTKVPGVKVATFANWFGGKDPKHDKEFFGALAVDPATHFTVYDDMSVTPDVLEKWKADPQGAIVGDVLAKKMGWTVGSKITLVSGIYPKQGDWEFHVVGTYDAKSKSVDRSTFIFRWDYLNDSLPEARKDQIGWIVARVTDPSRAAATGVEIDKMFDEKEIQTLSQDERAFNASFLASFSAVLTAIDLISIVILVIMGLVLGNTIAMGVRERTNEYGVLKALGFSNAHIVWFVMGEALVIGGAGGALGLLISYPFIEKGLGRFLEENMGAMFPYFRINPATTALAIGLAFGLAIVASVIPALQAGRLKTVDALKRLA